MRAILLVDDHEAFARLTCDILAIHGYHAVPAHSSFEALEKFAQQPFDVLVTDFRMDGLNGLELAQKLHQTHPQLPVIVITGFDPVADDDVRFCLQKEDLFPALLEKITLCLGETVPAAVARAVPRKQHARPRAKAV